MIPTMAMGQVGRRQGVAQNLIFMDFEGTNGSTTFMDVGVGASSWAAGGAAALDTGTVLNGSSSLKIPAFQTDYIEATANAANMLPATADWDLECDCRSTGWTLGGAGKTFLSVQDTTATAAGTQFAIATSGSANVVVVLSDGTTRAVVITSSFGVADNTNFTLQMRRRGGVIAIAKDGTNTTLGTFTGSINQPGSRKWRIGKPEIAQTGNPSIWIDRLRLRVYDNRP